MISVIVPVYNVEKYLYKSIKSICNQTYKNIEIILINDGSTDMSYEICERLRCEDQRITVINQSNQGVSAARNIGINHSQGKYIYFMDADDYIEQDMLQNMRKIYEKYTTDIVICGYYFETQINDKINKYEVRYKEVFYEDRDQLRKDFVKLWDKSLMYNIWNKLYKKDIIIKNKLRFPNYSMGEDLEFNKEYVRICKSVFVLDKCYYHYIRERQKSATTGYVKNWFDIRSEENERLKKYFCDFNVYNDEGREYLSRRYIERIIGCIENEFNINNNSKLIDKLKEINKILNSDGTKEAVMLAKPKSISMKLMLIPIKLNSTILTYLMGMSIAFVRINFNSCFQALKQNR